MINHKMLDAPSELLCRQIIWGTTADNFVDLSEHKSSVVYGILNLGETVT